MADGDAQFRLGVEHGYNEEPLYCWQDPFYQERYETGYALGRWQRITQDLDRRRGATAVADAVQAVLRRRYGLGRDGS
jgi:hypothetical protein